MARFKIGDVIQDRENKDFSVASITDLCYILVPVNKNMSLPLFPRAYPIEIIDRDIAYREEGHKFDNSLERLLDE